MDNSFISKKQQQIVHYFFNISFQILTLKSNNTINNDSIFIKYNYFKKNTY